MKIACWNLANILLSLRSTAMTKINLTKIFCSLYSHDFMIRCIKKSAAAISRARTIPTSVRRVCGKGSMAVGVLQGGLRCEKVGDRQ